MRSLEKVAINGMVPDLTIILDLGGGCAAPVRRGGDEGRPLRKEALDIHRRGGSLSKLRRAEPERCVVIDAVRRRKMSPPRSAPSSPARSAGRTRGRGGMSFVVSPRTIRHDPGIAEPAENPLLCRSRRGDGAGCVRLPRRQAASCAAAGRTVRHRQGDFAFHLAHHCWQSVAATAPARSAAPRETASPLFRQSRRSASGRAPSDAARERKTKSFKSVVTVDDTQDQPLPVDDLA